MRVYRVFTLCFCAMFLAPMASLSQDAATTYDLQQQWSIERDKDSRYALERRYFIPDELVGAFVDDAGAVYLCDKLTESLVKLGPGGSEVYSEGSVGDGPEDHRGAGEPVPWGEGLIARADGAVAPKIILYRTTGEYLESLAPDLDGQIARLFWNGTNGLAVALLNQFLPPDAFEFSTHLYRLDNGKVVQERKLRSRRVVRAPSKPERDVWDVPRMAVSADGYCFIQSDLYGNVIECLDRELKPLWSITGAWQPTPRSPAEIAEIQSQGMAWLEPSAVNQTVRRLVARSGGEVWVEPWRTDAGAGMAELESFGPGGRKQGLVRLVGVPNLPGEWILRGNKVLWITSDEADVANGSIPYIVVYDLVARR